MFAHAHVREDETAYVVELDVPDDVDVDHVAARYRGGTLELRVPRQRAPHRVDPARVHPDAEAV